VRARFPEGDRPTAPAPQPPRGWPPAILAAVLLAGLAAAGFPSAGRADDEPDETPSVRALFVPAPGAVWRTTLASGYDAYSHSYHLASTDTTETLTEFYLAAELEGRSAFRARHQWSVRGEVSAGTELTRESMTSRYRYRPGGGASRLGADVSWYGRQYREGSVYSLSSDNHEGRADLRGTPWQRRDLGLELRAYGRYLAYSRPSTLQQDLREGGGGLYLTSTGEPGNSWRAGMKAGRRAYPDSSAIDRDLMSGEFHLDRTGRRLELWVYHRSERRDMDDDTVRPSAWSHWTDMHLAWKVGRGRILADLGATVWSYDYTTDAYYDSHLADLELGYGWGEIPDPRWRALVTLERHGAGDSPDSYSQAGLQGGFESFGSVFSGTLAVEYGRRWYDHPVSDQDWREILESDDFLTGSTDFWYLEIWIMATWSLRENLDLDLMATYQPENHTEQDDDFALGTANLRLVWRP
jgi:hypothetical protein